MCACNAARRRKVQATQFNSVAHLMHIKRGRNRCNCSAFNVDDIHPLASLSQLRSGAIAETDLRELATTCQNVKYLEHQHAAWYACPRSNLDRAIIEDHACSAAYVTVYS